MTDHQASVADDAKPPAARGTAAAPAISAPTEDTRVTLARQTLTSSKQADANPGESARWWGRLENTVATLLTVIDDTPATPENNYVLGHEVTNPDALRVLGKLMRLIQEHGDQMANDVFIGIDALLFSDDPDYVPDDPNRPPGASSGLE